MLTDAALKALKARDKAYKVSDRDGMYAHVTVKGAVTFRLDYRLNGRRETVTLGKYGPDGLSLARARENASTLEGLWATVSRRRSKSNARSAA